MELARVAVGQNVRIRSLKPPPHGRGNSDRKIPKLTLSLVSLPSPSRPRVSV